MLFTLEALPARYGDAVLLHFGPPEAPQLAVLDGGTTTVYAKALKPRLAQLRAAYQARETARRAARGELVVPGQQLTLPVRLALVTHLDDDHIRGVLDWTDELLQLRDDQAQAPAAIQSFWLNAFDDLVGNHEIREGLLEHVGDAITASTSPGGFTWVPELDCYRSAALVLASVDQGYRLRKNARALSTLNAEFGGGPILAPAAGARIVDVDGLKLTVLGPLTAELQALETEWDRQLPEILRRQGRDRQAKAAAFADKSVFNLSSIVLLAELEGKRMLLTGDARGDLVLQGLETAGLLDANGKIHVDILKLPHHGSSRNVAPSFFERITADHYVVSSDGDKFNNPDLETLEMLSDVRGDQPFTLHLTYPAVHRTGSNDPTDGFAKDFDFDRTLALFARDRQAGKAYQVSFRAPGDRSIKVDLGTAPLSF